MTHPPIVVAVFSAIVSLAIESGCSERPRTTERPGRRLDEFRSIKFAGEKVVVPFRGGLQTAPIPEAAEGDIPKAGDRVVLSDSGDGEVFLARDLDALKFYHSSPGADQLARFRLLGDEGRLFVVARGTVGSVTKVIEGEPSPGLKAVELHLPGDEGEVAWVSDAFVRRAGDAPK